MTSKGVVLAIVLLTIIHRWINTANAFEYVLVDNGTASIAVSNDTTPHLLPDEAVVLYPDEYLVMGQYRYSPSREYRTGLSKNGDLIVEFLNLGGTPLVIWKAGIGAPEGSNNNSSSSVAVQCTLQPDGNLVVRNTESRQVLWRTQTGGYPDARVVIDDGGQLAIRSGSNRLWFGGFPRNYYTARASQDLTFPIRATFYYAW